MKRKWMEGPKWCDGYWWGMRSDEQCFVLPGDDKSKMDFDTFLDDDCICSMPPVGRCLIHHPVRT